MGEEAENSGLPSVADVLREADPAKALAIAEAFHAMATGVGRPTVWWAFALLQAHLISDAPPELHLWLAAQMARLCEVALPGALIAAERNRQGLPALSTIPPIRFDS